ncbi:hypothetical protein [Mesomycoplasma bovoculi]|uniref:Uncharacterized protein n=1 Tax=Mesomycoplasma bovoculi M165/69 TaxID=743966 RepID=W5V0E6_9BACT|nr:hypothetical protein [Mesomycoplasma bovoculi]AHH45273.1 hypothetical protein MYB_01315 [Mesomycoplasma bovoculi M165/69]
MQKKFMEFWKDLKSLIDNISEKIKQLCVDTIEFFKHTFEVKVSKIFKYPIHKFCIFANKKIKETKDILFFYFFLFNKNLYFQFRHSITE